MLELDCLKLYLNGAAACIPLSPALHAGLKRFSEVVDVHYLLLSDTVSDSSNFSLQI